MPYGRKGNMGIKERAIIFFDIDGTLCEYEGVPTGKVQEAFKKLHDNGHAAFICTGRGDPDIPEEIYDLGFDGVISCMGAEIRIHGENVRHVTISGEELVESVQVLLEHKMGALLLGAKEVLRTGYMKPVERETGVVWKTEDLFRNGKCVEIASIDSEYTDRALYDACRSVLEKHSEIIEYDAYNSQTQIRGINKANAIREVLNRSEYKGMTSYAIGDSQNDIPMFEEVDVGIAMGQAVGPVKEKAVFVTGTLEEEGVYYGLKHYHLI